MSHALYIVEQYRELYRSKGPQMILQRFKNMTAVEWRALVGESDYL